MSIVRLVADRIQMCVKHRFLVGEEFENFQLETLFFLLVYPIIPNYALFVALQLMCAPLTAAHPHKLIYLPLLLTSEAFYPHNEPVSNSDHLCRFYSVVIPLKQGVNPNVK